MSQQILKIMPEFVMISKFEIELKTLKFEIELKKLKFEIDDWSIMILKMRKTLVIRNQKKYKSTKTLKFSKFNKT